jgi:hypothetical protein
MIAVENDARCGLGASNIHSWQLPAACAPSSGEKALGATMPFSRCCKMRQWPGGAHAMSAESL